MRGRILGASATGNQGVILGDDGVRYTFTAQDWRDNTVAAAAGMTVEFDGNGSFAANIYTISGGVQAPTAQPYQAAPVGQFAPPPATPRVTAPSVAAPRVAAPRVASNSRQVWYAPQINQGTRPAAAEHSRMKPVSSRTSSTRQTRTEARQVYKNVGLLMLTWSDRAAHRHLLHGCTRMTPGTVHFDCFSM